MCQQYFCMYGKQCRTWSGIALCGIWSGSTLFAKVYLSQYLGLLWYIYILQYFSYIMYPKHWEHACPNLFWLSVDVANTCWMSGNKCRPCSDTTFCSIWSRSTLFAQACLSKYLEYSRFPISSNTLIIRTPLLFWSRLSKIALLVRTALSFLKLIFK